MQHHHCVLQVSSDAPPNSANEESYSIQKGAKTSGLHNTPGDHDYNPAPHPSHLKAEKGEAYLQENPVYTTEYAESIVPSHRPPKGVSTLLLSDC